MRRLFALLCVAAGFLVCAYSWHRATARTWETGPRRLAWFDAGGHPSNGVGCGNSALATTFLVEDRLLVQCHDGYAALDPQRGIATRTWVWDSMWPRAFAVGPDGRWGMLFETTRGGETVLALGLAGREGWLAAPQVVATVDNEANGLRPQALAMRWRDDGVDVVLSRPERTDPYGWYHAPEMVRLRATGALARMPLAFACDHCSVEGVRPTEAGYEVVRRDLSSSKRHDVAKPGVIGGLAYGRRFELVGGELVQSEDPARVPRPGGGAYLVDKTGGYITVDAGGHRTDPLSLRAHLGGRTNRLLYAMIGWPIAIALGLVFTLRARESRWKVLAIACAFYAITSVLALRTVLEVL